MQRIYGFFAELRMTESVSCRDSPGCSVCRPTSAEGGFAMKKILPAVAASILTIFALAPRGLATRVAEMSSEPIATSSESSRLAEQAGVTAGPIIIAQEPGYAPSVQDGSPDAQDNSGNGGDSAGSDDQSGTDADQNDNADSASDQNAQSDDNGDNADANQDGSGDDSQTDSGGGDSANQGAGNTMSQ
jgi:hypothetical protein